MKIKSISLEQWAEISRIRQKLVVLESQPINEAKASYWVGELYKSIGKKPPKVLFFDSPMAMQIAAFMTNYQLENQLRDQLRGQLWDQLWDQLKGQLRDQLGDQLRGQLGGQLKGQLRDQLRDQLWEQLWDQLGDQLRGQLGGQLKGQLRGQLWDQLRGQLRGQLWDQLRGQLWDQLWEQLRGQVDTQWLSCYLGWFKGAELVGAEFSEESWTLYCGYLENVSSILPFENIVFASHRPVEIHWRDGVLHNENGPAVLFADGWSVYAIDGVNVDKQIVEMPHTQSLTDINDEENEERKRIRISRYGWHKYLEEMSATVIDIATGQWMESLMQCGNMKILCTYDPSTGRPYALEVDPSCQTCEQAQRYLLAPEVALQGLGIDTHEAKTYPVLRT